MFYLCPSQFDTVIKAFNLNDTKIVFLIDCVLTSEDFFEY